MIFYPSEVTMARTITITGEMLIEAGTQIVLESGISALNIRSVAAKLNCSIQPIFRRFGNMDNLRAEILRSLDGVYGSFIAQFVDKENYLFTVSLAHIRLAEQQRNLFEAMFLTAEYGTRTVEQILSSSWNRETIECTAKQYGLSTEAAEDVYRDVRFYTFGIAREIYAGSIILHPGEAEKLLNGAVSAFTAQHL